MGGRPTLIEGDPRGPARIARSAVVWIAMAMACASAAAVPTFTEVKAAHQLSDVTLLDRHGVPIQTVRVDFRTRRLPWVGLEEMSPALLQAVVLSEDRRFWAHSGVDWSAVARSAFANLWHGRTRGASTVTMQLAGLIDDGLARPSEGRSLRQKVGQVVAARQLETRWRKDQILEAYLNSVPWRGELVGIHALSQTLFRKHPSGLDAHEAAIAAALVRAPNARPEVVGERACGVLQAMSMDCTGVRGLTHGALARPGGPAPGEQLAPHAARQVLAAWTGPPKPALPTTLDASLQRLAWRTLRTQLAELSGRQVEDGAVVVLDNASGEVRAWVGSVGPGSSAPQVDAVLARRQPGSTLKPFVYGLAFEQGLLGPASLLDDTPAEVGTPAGLYRPRNYDNRYQGRVSARTALGSSLNVPAVRVGALLPPEALFQRLNALGLDLPETGGYFGPSLALGSADVSLLALTNAYRTLANGGLFSPVTLHPGRPLQRPAGGRTTRSRVIDARAAFLVTDILADNNARALTFGLDSALATRGFAAVKTGTSKDMRDNWCIGYTDRYTVGVWVGNASGAPMHEVSGISGAAPVWQALVSHLHAQHPSRAPPPPPGVLRRPVDLAAAGEPVRSEWFLESGRAALAVRHSPGERTRVATVRAASRQPIGITHPVDGSVFAIDPDVPPQAQRIAFEGEHGTWVLNDRVLGAGFSWRWPPQPGRHELRLLDARGHVLQRVRFEVRGLVQSPLRRTALAGTSRVP